MTGSESSSEFSVNLRDESYVLNLYNFTCQYNFFIFAVGNLFYKRTTCRETRTARSWGSDRAGTTRSRGYDGARVLGIEILFEVTIRRVTVVLRELVTVGLRKVPNPCLGKRSG